MMLNFLSVATGLILVAVKTTDFPINTASFGAMRLNGVQEASSSNLDTRTKTVENVRFSAVFFYLLLSDFTGFSVRCYRVDTRLILKNKSLPGTTRGGILSYAAVFLASTMPSARM